MRYFVPAKSWLLLLIASATLLSCRDATQVTVEITTDIHCADRPRVGVSLGPPSELESRPLATETEQCDESTGRIGSIVLIPGKDKGEAFGLRVVAGMTRSAEECIEHGYLGGCVVARRVLSFVPHDNLRLPIRLEASCIDVPCDATQTCRGGSCVSAIIADPNKCAGAGCDVLVPGGASAGGASNRSGTSSPGGTNNMTTSVSHAGAPGFGGIPNSSGPEEIGGTVTTAGTYGSGGTFATGGFTTTGGTSATGRTFATGGFTTTGGTSATGGFATTGGTSATGGTSVTGGFATTGGISTASGGSAGTSFSPLCSMTAGGSPTIKGGVCSASDTQLCYWTCGPMSVGHKSETCSAGIYVESDCYFPNDVDYSCFQLPQADAAGCPTTAPQSGQPCSVATCSLPCAGAACALCGVTTGYRDSLGTHKDGYCVCVSTTNGNRWSCSSITAWPCPSGQGC